MMKTILTVFLLLRHGVSSNPADQSLSIVLWETSSVFVIFSGILEMWNVSSRTV